MFISLLMINVRNEIVVDYTNPLLIIQSIGAALLITICCVRKGLLINKVISKLGDYSYEFYIVHFVVLLFCKSLVSNVISFWFLSLLIAMVASFVMHQFQVRIVEHIAK